MKGGTGWNGSTVIHPWILFMIFARDAAYLTSVMTIKTRIHVRQPSTLFIRYLDSHAQSRYISLIFE